MYKFLSLYTRPGYQKALELGNSVPRPKGFCEVDKVKLFAVLLQTQECRVINLLIFLKI